MLPFTLIKYASRYLLVQMQQFQEVVKLPDTLHAFILKSSET